MESRKTEWPNKLAQNGVKTFMQQTTIWQDFMIRQAQCSDVAIVPTSKALLKNLDWQEQICKRGILLPKLFWPTVWKNCSSDREKLVQLDDEDWEFCKNFEITAQFVQTVKGHNDYW